MCWAKILSVGIIVLMSVLLGNILINDGFNSGLGMDRFIDGLKDPWQAFIGFDMMSGLFLMFGWIIYRQMRCASVRDDHLGAARQLVG